VKPIICDRCEKGFHWTWEAALKCSPRQPTIRIVSGIVVQSGHWDSR
jgi:hypothetical protein